MKRNYGKHLLGAVFLILALLMVPSFSVQAQTTPTITKMYVATAYGQDQAAANNGTTATITVTGTYLSGASSMTFYLGAIVDPNITVTNITLISSTQIRVDVVVAANAAAGPRNVTVTAIAGTSAVYANGFIVYRATMSVGTPAGVSPGSDFKVYINVNNVANMNSYQFDLSYNINVLRMNGNENIDGVTDGIITVVVLTPSERAMPTTGWTYQPTPGIPSDTIRVIGQLGAANRSVTGSGYIAAIEFTVIGEVGASSDLVLSNVGIFNSNANKITPDTITNGSVPVIGLSINNASLPEGVVGAEYTGSLTAIGGIAPYTWGATGLPAGLSLNASSGVISGTPSVNGDFAVSITVTDSKTPAPDSMTQLFNLKIYPVLQISTTALPEATQYKVYSGITLSATGGMAPYSWAAGNLPTGLSISTGGVISGTPDVSGNFKVILTVSDNFNPRNTAIKELALQVYAQLQITTSSLPTGVRGSSYTTTVTAGGGKTPYTWSAAGLPSGLSINAASGIISGTPDVSGIFGSVSITVSDAFTPANTFTANFTLNISEGVFITTTSLNEGVAGAAYTFTLAATGGTPPYIWGATGLPGGFSLNTSTGVISGTTTASGDFPINITVNDSNAVTPSNDSKTLSLKVNPALQITTATLPEGMRNVSYAGITLSATGGFSTLSWGAAGLPDGLSINNNGSISGTPAAYGDFNVTVTVTDSYLPINNTASKTLLLRVYSPLQITTVSLPDGSIGSNYAFTVTAEGGKKPYNWSAAGLPSDLSINAGSGAITGIPQVSGDFNPVVITVSDAFSPANTTTANFSLHIGEGVTITTVTLPEAVSGAAYTFMLEARGGTPPYTWSATGLPGGLSLNTDTGLISGTTTASGDFPINVTVTDSSSPAGTGFKIFTLTVYAQLVIETTELTRSAVEVYPQVIPSYWVIPPAGWVINQPYQSTLKAMGGKGPYTWSAAGLPPGLTLDPVTGVLSGTPGTRGEYNIIFSVRDSFDAPNTANKTLTLRIYIAGDANNDGEVTVGDVTFVQRVLFKLLAPNAGCDVNLNLVINIGDVTGIQRKILGYP